MKLITSLDSRSPLSSRFLTALTGCAVLALGSVAAFAQPAHLSKGLQLVDEITAAQSQGVYTGSVAGADVFLNRYGGSWDSVSDPSFIRFFNAATNTYAANYTTCAPLVTHLLKYTYGWNWKLIGIPNPLAGGALAYKSSPSSYLYVSAIKNLVAFTQRSVNLADVQPGDIAARWEVGTDTGHTMIVVGVNFASAKLYPLASTNADFIPALAGSTYIEMNVLDSSASSHTNDTRLITYNGVTSASGGAGVGTMGVFINGAGEIIAHTWSLPTSSYQSTKNGVTTVSSGWISGIKSRVKMQGEVELVIGRLPPMASIVP
jgi:hypothetical protein